MLKDAPAPIRATFWKYTLLYCAIVVFGLIWGTVMSDKDFLFLTAAITVLGAWRTINLYQTIHHTKYRTLEGMIVSDVNYPLRNRHCVTMQMEDGSQTKEIVSGSRIFIPTQTYRIYLHSSVQPDMVSTLPEALRPVQTLLGYEMKD